MGWRDVPVYVYALVDPRDDTINYVGTTDNLVRRSRTHWRYKTKNKSVEAWLNELRALNLKPKYRVLETTDIYVRYRREMCWIMKYHLEGQPLRNRVGNPGVRIVSANGNEL